MAWHRYRTAQNLHFFILPNIDIYVYDSSIFCYSGSIAMKNIKALLIVVSLMFLLGACSPKEELTLNEATMSALYTSVVQTLAISPPVPTATPTPTLEATVTPTPSATQGLVTPTATRYVATVSACDNAVWVSDVTIPDNTVMTPGQKFTKTWSIKNAGTCNWTTGYKLVFLSGNAMSGVSTALTTAVDAGHADNVSLALVAPITKGTYTGYWIMQNAAGQTFGQQVYVSIVVSTSMTATTTGTITPTPNLTSTANALATTIAGANYYAGTATAAAATAAADAAATAAANATATAAAETATAEASASAAAGGG